MIVVDTLLRKRAAEGRPVRVGMIGAGITHPPAECFDRALAALSGAPP